MNKYRKAFLEGRGHLKPAPVVVAAVPVAPVAPITVETPVELTDEELEALTAPSSVDG
jgi:hypothetical protein